MSEQSSSIRRPSTAADRVSNWPAWMQSVAAAPLRPDAPVSQQQGNTSHPSAPGERRGE